MAAELERRFPGCMCWDDAVTIHHNDATREHHYGRSVWVHRKARSRHRLVLRDHARGADSAGAEPAAT